MRDQLAGLQVHGALAMRAGQRLVGGLAAGGGLGCHHLLRPFVLIGLVGGQLVAPAVGQRCGFAQSGDAAGPRLGFGVGALAGA